MAHETDTPFDPSQDDLHPANMARELHALKKRVDRLEAARKKSAAPANPVKPIVPPTGEPA